MGQKAAESQGPLQGIRVVEIAGLGAAPFCGMILSDLGAEVIRVCKPSEIETGSKLHALLGVPHAAPAADVMNRGRKSIAVNLKHPEGRELVLKLVEGADAIIEGFRPGVAERLGVGPNDCTAVNPRVVYGRMTGWGQEGPYAQTAGHDINYIALTGALHSFGRRNGAPAPPLNLVGDFGGGGLILAAGVLAAIIEMRTSGRGQVVDAAMVDGASLMMSMMYGLRAAGAWVDERESNFNDAGAHFYNVYETSDGKFLAVGAIETQFYIELIERLGLDIDVNNQWNPESWQTTRDMVAKVFSQGTMAHWCKIFEGADACVAPVLSMADAPLHPHNIQRKTFMEIEGVIQPSPAPRFSRTPLATPTAPTSAGAHTAEILRNLGLEDEIVSELRRLGVVAWPDASN